jgi:hypothetical protein
MQDTLWNLCPTPGNSFFDIATTQAEENADYDKTYIVGCYYAPDEEQTFDQLAGEAPPRLLPSRGSCGRIARGGYKCIRGTAS